MNGTGNRALGVGLAEGAPVLRIAAAFGLFEAAFYLAYHSSMTFRQTVAAPFWFPDAVLLCALLLVRPGWWWLFILGPLPIRLLVDVSPDAATWFLLSVYAVDSLKAVFVATALRTFLRDPLRLETTRDLLLYGLFAVLLGPMLAGLGGAAARAGLGFSYWPAWGQWFLGNAFTHLVVTPAVLYWVARPDWPQPLPAARRLESMLLAAGLVASAYLAFSAFERAAGREVFACPQLYAPVPFLFWAAIRFGMLGASGAIAVLAFFAVSATLESRGPLSAPSSSDASLALQYFLMMGAATLYLIAVLIGQKSAAERSLRESERRFRAMADSAPVMIWMSGPDRRCEFVNQGWLDFTGKTQEEERGTGWALGVHPDDEAQSLGVYESAFMARRPFEVEYRLRRRDGEYRWLLDRGLPRYAPGGGFLGYVGSAIDITDRRRTEEARRNLAQATRLAALGDLTALLAHEVNQPLAAILANADAARILLRSDSPPLAEIRDIIDDIRQSNLRADEVIRRVRELMRRREIQLAALDLDETIDDVLHFVGGDAERRGASIGRVPSARLPLVRGDRIHLQHVLLNLLANAMDAMDGLPSSERRIEVATRRSEGMVEVSVSDRGPGIAPDMLQRIFDSFVGSRHKGTGLGLSVAASIIESHGGRIWAENNAGGGATLRFTVRVAG